MRYVVFDTAWGAFGFVEQDRRLVATFLPPARRETIRAIRTSWPQAVETFDLLPRFQRAVVDYFDGRRTLLSIEIDVRRLPPFYQLVLEACRRVPHGQTASYADLARAAGKPNAARAVGGAMARNPLPLVVPCHRVLHSDGTIGGFSSAHGVDEKTRLLRLEGILFTRNRDEDAARAATGPTFAFFKRLSAKRRVAVAV